MVRILIADDHPVIHEGLSSLLGLIKDFSVAGKAANGREAVELYRSLKPDVTLMDLAMPEMGGVEAIAAIRREFPDARIIALTVYAGEEDIYRAFQAGAKAYLLKKASVEEIVATIRMVYAGEAKIPPYIAQSLFNREIGESLSERELEVLHMMAQGKTNEEIAAHLGITLRTVKAHMTSIMAKLGATNRTQAVSIAVRKGYIHLE